MWDNTPVSFNLDHPLVHITMGIGHKKVFKDEFRNFPKLAHHLFPLGDDLVTQRDYSSILALRFADFIPKNYFIGGNTV